MICLYLYKKARSTTMVKFQIVISPRFSLGFGASKFVESVKVVATLLSNWKVIIFLGLR